MSEAIRDAQKRRYDWRHGAHTYSRSNNIRCLTTRLSVHTRVPALGSDAGLQDLRLTGDGVVELKPCCNPAEHDETEVFPQHGGPS